MNILTSEDITIPIIVPNRTSGSIKLLILSVRFHNTRVTIFGHLIVVKQKLYYIYATALEIRAVTLYFCIHIAAILFNNKTVNKLYWTTGIVCNCIIKYIHTGNQLNTPEHKVRTYMAHHQNVRSHNYNFRHNRGVRHQ